MSHLYKCYPFSSLHAVVEISLIANETVFEEFIGMEPIIINISATATVSNGGVLPTNFAVDLSTSNSTASEFLF